MRVNACSTNLVALVPVGPPRNLWLSRDSRELDILRIVGTSVILLLGSSEGGFKNSLLKQLRPNDPRRYLFNDSDTEVERR